jgi:hypothetical protein
VYHVAVGYNSSFFGFPTVTGTKNEIILLVKNQSYRTQTDCRAFTTILTWPVHPVRPRIDSVNN